MFHFPIVFNGFIIRCALVSSLPGAINDPKGNFLNSWGRGALGDMIGNISIPLKLGFGTRLAMEGFVKALLENLTSDIMTGGNAIADFLYQ